jgi:hypothetical protein
MLKIRIILILSIALAFSSVLFACNKNPEILTVEQVTELVQTYFKELYNLNVMVENVSYERVGLHDYLNKVRVSNGETEYNLFLDRNNKPLADDYRVVETVNNTDISMFDDMVNSLGFENPHLESVIGGYEYSSWFFVSPSERPNKDSKDGIYSLLGALNSEGVDVLAIYISSPNFLLPKMEFGHGVHGVQLAVENFETNVTKAKFEEQYNEFVDSVLWDEHKFEEKVSQLTQRGYKNAYFFISGYYTGNTIEIVLYCESDGSLTDEQANALLEDMDDSYFKIRNKKTKYTLQHDANESRERYGPTTPP